MCLALSHLPFFGFQNALVAICPVCFEFAYYISPLYDGFFPRTPVVTTGKGLTGPETPFPTRVLEDDGNLSSLSMRPRNPVREDPVSQHHADPGASCSFGR